MPRRIGGVINPLHLASDVVEIEPGDQRGHRRDQEYRARDQREPSEPLDRLLDPARQADEMPKPPFRDDDQQDQKRDGEAHAFEQDRPEGRREQLLEGLTCGDEHDVSLCRRGPRI